MGQQGIREKHAGGGISKTRQSDALPSDINSIMSKYIQTGTVPVTGKEPTYGDYGNAVTFHEAANRVLKMKEDFNALPAAVKKHCNQDPGEFLDMVYDPTRSQELLDLGLIEERTPKEAPEPVPPVPEPDPEPSPEPE